VTPISATHLVEMLLLPPTGPLLLMVAGITFFQGNRRIRHATVFIGISILFIFSTPFITNILFEGLELKKGQGIAQSVIPPPEAIVVIAGPDAYFNAPEYGTDTAAPGMLMRLRYAAYLQRITGLPIAVIGGDATGRGIAATQYMRAILENEFKIPVKLSNSQSNHTFDNAKYAAEELASEDIQSIYLVTHSWHMRRAKKAFEHAGLYITPASTGYPNHNEFTHGPYSLLPRADSMALNNRLLHEYLGLALSWIFLPQDQ
jgi:uncharacterized SAM-binding protein YcdF (DUF218 family)